MNQYMAIALSAGIPFLTILLGMFFNNQRFNAIDKRFDAIGSPAAT